MAPACSCFAGPVPVAWLGGDVLAEYLRFLEEGAPSPPPTQVPVAWLEGEVRDEFLRFLEESWAAAAAVVDPEERQEEVERAARDGGGGADGYDDGGLVVDNEHGSFVDDGGESGVKEEGACTMEDEDGGVETGVTEEDACAMEGDDDESEDGGVCMESDEQEAEAVLELLLPYILDLPAFRARAAAPVQQEPAPGSPDYLGGWLQRRASLMEEDSSSSSSSSDDEEMSLEEEEIEEAKR